MPEFLHSFQAGKMNKDYDDRLVPNGEYRDALNLEVTDSEGSDVGVLQNVKGNTEIINKKFNESLQSFTVWSTNYIDSLTNAICIGSIVDDTTEKIYWFVASDEASIVAEYDQTADVITPIVVDTQNILNFSKSYLITGINVVEGILLWTDNQSEPKSLNINRWKALNTPNFQTHTKIYGRDFQEQDLTVIRKKPLTALGLDMSTSTRGGAGTGLSPVITTYPGGVTANGESTLNFTYLANIANPGDYEPIPTYSAVQSAAPGTYPASLTGVITIVTNIAANYRAQDRITLTTTINDGGSQIEYKIRLLVVGPLDPSGKLIPSTTLNCQIQSIPSNLPRGNSAYIWTVLLDEINPLYNLSFPRFSYRWKYNNNNISTFAPFTEVAFLGGEFKYKSSDGYNTGMTNNIRKLTLTNIDWGNPDVEEVEILYKSSDSPNVYSLAKLKRSAGLVTDYTVTNEITGATIESIQLLRPYDNVPRKAKAQEVVANRLMYGNYTQQYNVDVPNIVISTINNSRDTDVLPIGTPMPSLKSIRTYQAGISLLDKYGRETPIFTSNESASIVRITQSVESTSLQGIITGNWVAPSWATHYKYFIKETSQEYYNISLDRYYPAEDGNIWLSFPSSERNKLVENNFIILKKQHNSNIPITETNRYKILAIESEAPEFIATENINTATAKCFTLTNNKPGPGVITFKVKGPGNAINNNFFTSIDSSKQLVIQQGSNKTEAYDIETGGPESLNGANDIDYAFTLTKALGEDDADFLSLIGDNVELTIHITEKRVQILPEFEGRFFVRIELDNLLQASIIDPFTETAKEYGIISSNSIVLSSINNGPGNGNQSHAWKDHNSADPIDWKTAINGVPDLNKGQAPTFGSKNVSYVISGFGGDGDLKQPTASNTSSLMFDYFSKQGTNLRFIGPAGEVSQIYRISKTTGLLTSRRGYRDAFNKQRKLFSNSRAYCGVVLNKAFAETWLPVEMQAVRAINEGNPRILASTNPAIFETEPNPSVDLNLFYQASGAYPIADIATPKKLPWFNCYSYGNGVESNRIRDDYNAVTIDKGPIVSAPLDIPYQEEVRLGGLIFSGIFNSVSGVNNLNQFIQADSITKNLNPYYGSIQALKARDTDMIVLCEDKILNILANKDALYNADGQPQLLASDRVLGQAVPYVGEYGISKNPESLASFGFRMYFTDKARGTVLRLSRDGLEPIGEKGMSAFFIDNLLASSTLAGCFDSNKGAYNLTLDNLTPKWQKLLASGKFDRTNPDCEEFTPEGLTTQTTISFKENADGWTSRMSFIPESGCSLNSKFYTFKNGGLWAHDHDTNPLYNNFYGIQYDSSVNVLINDSPEIVKGFKTLNYTGSRQREYVYTIGGTRNYSLAEIKAELLTPTDQTIKPGWYVNHISTDLQEGHIKEFIKKEGKYFNYIKGLETFFNTNCDTNVNTQEFAVQGIGRPSSITGDVDRTEFAIHVFINPEY
jgi:hypothetical protein